MSELNQLGVAFILWVQSLYPALDSCFKILNFLQTEEFFLVVLPVIWWCFDKRIGASLAIVFLLSDYFVRVLKGITNVTRPYDAEPRIRSLDPQADTSFPSAGAMDSTIFWAYLAVLLRSRVLWIIAVIAIFVMSFTRIYLGAHYPSDVVASVFLGAVVILIVLGGRVADRLAANARAVNGALALTAPIFFAVVRLNHETAVTLGALLGFASGILIETRYVQFEPRSTWGKQITKALIGIGAGLAIRMALKSLLPDSDIFTLMRYSVIGLWMGVGAPWVFVTLRLAGSALAKQKLTGHAQISS